VGTSDIGQRDEGAVANSRDRTALGWLILGPAGTHDLFMPSPGSSSEDGSPRRAVFLSYAREDSAAAQRIAEALRSHGIEVWFDQNELRRSGSKSIPAHFFSRLFPGIRRSAARAISGWNGSWRSSRRTS